MKAIQDEARIIGENGCLAFVYANIVEQIHVDGWDPSTLPCQLKLFADVIDGMLSGHISEGDCYVKDAEKYMHYLDPKHKYRVTKKDIKSMKDLRGEIGAVRFDHNGKSHWVGFADGTVVFDSLTDSVCRKYGLPTTARIVEIDRW